MKLKLLSEIKKDYYLMISSIFLMKTGQFMSLPFLAIYLYKHLSASSIGLIIGTGAFVYGFFGITAGIIADKIGSKKSLIIALLISGISLILFFQVTSLWWYLAMSIMFGIGRSIFNISSKTYGSTYRLPVRRLCFSLRNMMVDAAAAVGPLIGAIFSARQSEYIFPFIGFLYFSLAIMSSITLKEASVEKKHAASYQSFYVILKDRNLLLLVGIFCIYWIAFSEIDSILPIYLSTHLKNGIHIYTLLLIIQAVGCVLLQLAFTYVTRNFADFTLAMLGMILFGLAYAIIALFLNTPMLIIASIFIIFAQIIVLPLNDLLISKMAPEHQMATYYGAITLSAVGMGIGPMLGGFIYQHFGITILFILLSIACLLCIPLYFLLIKKITLQISANNFN